MVEGWDFETNDDLTETTDPDDNGHGTYVAGIIGTIRNNNFGIAGIAGGDYDVSTNFEDRGVSLYGLKTTNPVPTLPPRQ